MVTAPKLELAHRTRRAAAMRRSCVATAGRRRPASGAHAPSPPRSVPECAPARAICLDAGRWGRTRRRRCCGRRTPARSRACGPAGLHGDQKRAGAEGGRGVAAAARRPRGSAAGRPLVDVGRSAVGGLVHVRHDLGRAHERDEPEPRRRRGQVGGAGRGGGNSVIGPRRPPRTGRPPVGTRCRTWRWRRPSGRRSARR